VTIRIPTQSTLTRSALVILTLALALVAAMPATAEPDTEEIRSKRAQAEVARAEIARLGAELGPAVERYNQAVLELEQVEADIAFNKQQIAFTRKNLKRTQSALGEKLAQSYRVGEPDLLASILGQQTLNEVLAVTDLFQRQQDQASDLIGGLQSDRAGEGRGASRGVAGAA
jgi:peptidoglycan hydrolase CwlO-like protein